MSDIVELSADRAQAFRSARRAEQLRAGLPPTTTTRWVASRKAAVVAAVNHGVLTEDQVQHMYGVSSEELAHWRESLEKHGVGGLRATRTQLYRGE